MPMPKAYEPAEGYTFQILCRMCGEREYEHCDYAEDSAEKKYLLANYRDAYGAGFEFHTILLPAKYWPSPARRAELRAERKAAEAAKQAKQFAHAFADSPWCGS